MGLHLIPSAYINSTYDIDFQLESNGTQEIIDLITGSED